MPIDPNTGTLSPSVADLDRKRVGRYQLFGYGFPDIACGHGAPTKDSPVGSLYLNLDGGSGTTLYVKEAAGVAGWVGK